MNEQKKQYTGTKTVKATSMTMGEPYERKLLKEGVRPSECETDKAGYLVEYKGGYQSWSPADVFDKTYKLSETFIDRLRIEYADVKERLDNLEEFFKPGFDEVAKKIGAWQTALLTYQIFVMKTYVEVLGVRIDNIEQSIKNSK